MRSVSVNPDCISKFNELKLGKSLKGQELTDVLGRLRAIDANRSSMPIPKGPVPTSMKGMRGQMRGR